MTNELRTESSGDEEALGRLVREAGPRQSPPAAAIDVVREAAYSEWKSVVAQRKRRRRVQWSALAASIAVISAGLAVRVSGPGFLAPRGPVAMINRLSGMVEINNGRSNQGWFPAHVDDGLSISQDVRTGTGGRAALRIGHSVSVRLAENTAIELTGSDHISLIAGAIYVDSGERPGADQLVIDTPFGSASHLGTQYEVRLVDDAVRLRVREGRVEFRQHRDPYAANAPTVIGTAGEQLTITRGGSMERVSVARYGESWAWISEVAPVFDIENRSLLEFLHWAGRETGQQLVFATPESESEARKLGAARIHEGSQPDRRSGSRTRDHPVDSPQRQ